MQEHASAMLMSTSQAGPTRLWRLIQPAAAAKAASRTAGVRSSASARTAGATDSLRTATSTPWHMQNCLWPARLHIWQLIAETQCGKIPVSEGLAWLFPSCISGVLRNSGTDIPCMDLMSTSYAQSVHNYNYPRWQAQTCSTSVSSACSAARRTRECACNRPAARERDRSPAIGASASAGSCTASAATPLHPTCTRRAFSRFQADPWSECKIVSALSAFAHQQEHNTALCM